MKQNDDKTEEFQSQMTSEELNFLQRFIEHENHQNDVFGNELALSIHHKFFQYSRSQAIQDPD